MEHIVMFQCDMYCCRQAEHQGLWTYCCVVNPSPWWNLCKNQPRRYYFGDAGKTWLGIHPSCWLRAREVWSTLIFYRKIVKYPLMPYFRDDRNIEDRYDM